MYQNHSTRCQPGINFLKGIIFFLGLWGANFVFATTSGYTIGDVAQQVSTSFGELAKLITAGAYIAGMGFGLAAILKFKAHKDNPTQIPVGTPIALLFIAAALLFLPTIFEISGGTLFGSSGTVGGIGGLTSF